MGDANNPKGIWARGTLETLWEQPQELFQGEIKLGMSPFPKDYPGKAQGEGRSSPEPRLFPELWIGSGGSETQPVGGGKLG